MNELINNFSKQHNYYKVVTLTAILGLILCIIISIFFNYRFIKEKSGETYVALDGKVYKAIAVQNYS